jgi:hypothetical protein
MKSLARGAAQFFSDSGTALDHMHMPRWGMVAILPNTSYMIPVSCSPVRETRPAQRAARSARSALFGLRSERNGRFEMKTPEREVCRRAQVSVPKCGCGALLVLRGYYAAEELTL